MQARELQAVLLGSYGMRLEDSQMDVLGWVVADPHAARYLVEPPSRPPNQQAYLSALFLVV